MDKRRRRELIREMIEGGSYHSQWELVQALSKMGVDVDQSTVSRDLRELGVVRLPGRGGGTVYGFPSGISGPPAEEELRRGLRGFLLGAEPSGNLIVLRTAPGNAQALAILLDRAHLDEVAGTLAGDDTIMVVVREGSDARELSDRLTGLSS